MWTLPADEVTHSLHLGQVKDQVAKAVQGLCLASENEITSYYWSRARVLLSSPPLAFWKLTVLGGNEEVSNLVFYAQSTIMVISGRRRRRRLWQPAVVKTVLSVKIYC